MRSGPLSAELDGADLRSVRWGGLEVASRIQVTVRDGHWGTLRPVVRRAEVDESQGRFSVLLEAAHGDGAFAWRGSIEATADGTLTFAFEGIAERDLVYRRIGLCVEHPWAPYVGASYRASGTGPVAEGIFPQDIAPQLLVDDVYQPLIPAFHELAVAFPDGPRAGFTFDGEPEGYELEDQRNWTDASFKSYPTPLWRSQPRTLRRGDGLRQRMELRVEGRPAGSADEDGPVRVVVGGSTGRRMPDIGLTAPIDPLDADALRDLLPAHLRTVVVPSVGDANTARTGGAGVPLELVYLVEDGSTSWPPVEGSIARLLVLRRDGATSDGAFIANARAGVGRDVTLCGGTSSHFSELNRRHPDPRGMDAIAVALTPQMHAIDERSMVASLEIQAQIVTQVRSMTGGLPVVVSPVTLASHEGSDGLDDAPDARVGSPFGAAWTVGSVASLARAGAVSVTLHEAVDRTVLTSAVLTAAVRELTARRGLPLEAVQTSDLRRVVAIAAEGVPLLLANLTPEAQDVELGGSAVGGRTLAPYEVALVERSPR